jgi:thioesterase domain-containing protein
MGEERPVYALQARGLDGEPVEEQRLEEMVATYLEEIREVQPHGPYYLGGYCLGGTLAMEAAQQLRAQGEAVPLVVMLHTATKEYHRYPADMSAMRQSLCSLRSRWALESHNLFDRNPGDIFRYAVDRLGRMTDVFKARVELMLDRRQGRTPMETKSRSMIYHLEKLGISVEMAAAAYQEQPYDGRVLLLCAQRQPYGLQQSSALGWDKLLSGKFEIREIPGFRQNMLIEPNVSIVASYIAEAFHDVERAAPQLEPQLSARIPVLS